MVDAAVIPDHATTATTLSDAQKQQFIHEGYLVLSGLIPDEAVARTREAILDRHGMRLDDPSTWKTDKKTLFDDYDLTVACQTEAIYQAAEQLVGPNFLRGTVYSPYREKQGLDPWMPGYIPVLIYPTPGERRFEAPNAYHLDGMHLTTLWPKSLYLVVFAYLTDVPAYAGATALWPGKHRDMFEYWHSRVSADKDTIPGSTPELKLGEPIPFVGKAGDVVLMHYLLPHQGSPNHGDGIRIGLNTGIQPDPGRPYRPKTGAPNATWTPLDWTLRTENLGTNK